MISQSLISSLYNKETREGTRGKGDLFTGPSPSVIMTTKHILSQIMDLTYHLPSGFCD